MAETPKRKYPSGAAKRKMRAEREAKARNETRNNSPSPLQSGKLLWSAASSYDAATEIDPNKPPQQLPIYGQPPPTLVRAVSTTITQLEQGQFYASAYLADGMMRDDRLSATTDVRINGVLGQKLELEPADEDDKQAIDVADDLERNIAYMVPPAQLYQLMYWGLYISVGVAQVDWQAEIPTFRVWNPRYLRYDWSIRRYRLVTENRGEITLEPGDPEWIIWEPFGEHGWLRSAMIRSLALPWLIRYWVRNWWSRHQEVHGQPVRIGILPPVRTPQDQAVFLTQLKNMAHEAVMAFEQGEDGNKFDVKLLEATANTWEGFKQLLDHCDDSFAIKLLGQRQSTKGQGGLGSQENAGQDVRVDIKRGDALVGQCLRDQFLKRWAFNNYGDPELAPYPKWQVEPPEDESKTALTDLNVAKALQAFKAAGAPVDIREYLTERGYPLLTEEEHQKQQQEAIDMAQQAMGEGADGKDPAMARPSAPKPAKDEEEND